MSRSFSRASLALVGIVLFSIHAAPLVPLHGARALAGPTVTVNVGANRHAISNDIYGVTFWYNNSNPSAETSFAQAIHLPVSRQGGDATTRYNWQVDSSNAARDWYFMAGNGQANATPGASDDQLVQDNRASGAKTILTIPIINYINGSSPWHCSYPKSKYGDQQSYNPYVHPNGDQCGNGYSASTGKALTDTDIGATDIPNDPSIQAAWVRHLVGKFGSAANGGVPIYEMDNEPNGWIGMHFDVRPNGIGYTELRDRTEAYAAAVKSADPTAAVLGPGDIPPAAYDCNSCGNDGSGAHGGVPLGEWYLQQMAAYQQQHGVRLLDYYSMHYPGYYGSDPITGTLNGIHLFQGWINAAYPGTKLAFDEYNYGGADSFSNALVEAEALGVFGREGVDLASFWGLDNVTWPTGYIFRLYRDYDGQGSMFGDTSVSASTTNFGQLAVFAAQRSRDGALTVMVINPTGSALSSTLALSGYAPAPTAAVYQYSAANTGGIVQGGNLAVASGGFTATYAAQSATMVVLKPANGTSPTSTPTTTATPTKTTTPTPGSKTPTPGAGTPTVTPTPPPVCVTATADAATPASAAATPCATAVALSGGNGGGSGGTSPGKGGGGGGIFLWIALILLLGGAGCVLLLLRRNRRDQPALAPAGLDDWRATTTRQTRAGGWDDAGRVWDDAESDTQRGRVWSDDGQTQWDQRPGWDD